MGAWLGTGGTITMEEIYVNAPDLPQAREILASSRSEDDTPFKNYVIPM
jgi:hypothetical protein